MEARLGSHNKSVGESGMNPFLSILALFSSLCAFEHRVAIFFACFIQEYLPPSGYLPGDSCAHRRPFGHGTPWQSSSSGFQEGV